MRARAILSATAIALATVGCSGAEPPPPVDLEVAVTSYPEPEPTSSAAPVKTSAPVHGDQPGRAAMFPLDNLTATTPLKKELDGGQWTAKGLDGDDAVLIEEQLIGEALALGRTMEAVTPGIVATMRQGDELRFRFPFPQNDCDLVYATSDGVEELDMNLLLDLTNFPGMPGGVIPGMATIPPIAQDTTNGTTAIIGAETCFSFPIPIPMPTSTSLFIVEVTATRGSGLVAAQAFKVKK